VTCLYLRVLCARCVSNITRSSIAPTAATRSDASWFEKNDCSGETPCVGWNSTCAIGITSHHRPVVVAGRATGVASTGGKGQSVQDS